MKVVITPIFKTSDADYLRRCYRLPMDRLQSQGWTFIQPGDIVGGFRQYFIDQYKTIPEILLFWSYNYKIFLMWDIIYLHSQDILNEKYWLKCVYLDDIHTPLSAPFDMQRKFVFQNFDLILTPGAALFKKFYPEIATHKVLSVPHFVNHDFLVGFNSQPLNRILLSGVMDKYYYPFRHMLYTLANHHKYPIDVLKSSDKPSQDLSYGKSYILKLNEYLAAFATSGNRNLPYVVAKFFEIPASGALMLAHDELVKTQLLKLGFKANVHYISITHQNLHAVLGFVLNPRNRHFIDKIRRQGYDFVWKYHTSHNRADMIDALCCAAL